MRTGKMEAAREAAQSMDSVRLGENLTQYTANLLVTQVTSTGTVTSIRSSLSTSMALYDIIQYHCILSICKSSINGYVSIAMLNYSKPQKDLEEVIGRYLSVILVILLFHQFVGEKLYRTNTCQSFENPPQILHHRHQAQPRLSPQKLSVSS